MIHGVSYLRWIGGFYFLSFAGHLFVSWYRGTGRMNITFWGTTIQVAVRVVLSYLLVSAMGLGAVGLATGIGWIVIVMFHGGVFILERKGIWPKQALKNCVNIQSPNGEKLIKMHINIRIIMIFMKNEQRDWNVDLSFASAELVCLNTKAGLSIILNREKAIA